MILFRFVATLVAVAILATTAQAVDIETVPVGDAGNANDTHFNILASGRVDYTYDIGKYEVTAGQYTEFLNAVARTDTYGLYNNYMWSNTWGCKIQRSGSPGSYSYSVWSGRASRPVSHVSWGDAARFANWLHNDQPTGAQDSSTTEDGSYFLNGANDDAALLAITRESDATWVIPSEDEWYKAAYYDGENSVYYDYPTGTDARPDNGNSGGDTGNTANFCELGPMGDDDYTIGAPYWRTPVGYFRLSESPYGTFDQGGNVEEWNEPNITAGGISVRGGNYADPIDLLTAFFNSGKSSKTELREYDGRGFRVARVTPIPEPSAIILLLTGALGFLLYRKRRS